MINSKWATLALPGAEIFRGGCCVWHGGGGGDIVPPINISAPGRARVAHLEFVMTTENHSLSHKNILFVDFMT